MIERLPRLFIALAVLGLAVLVAAKVFGTGAKYANKVL